MLSVFASTFKAGIPLSCHKKYGKEYPDSFTGKEAVANSLFDTQDLLYKINNFTDRIWR
jgi:hypothetical protein